MQTQRRQIAWDWVQANAVGWANPDQADNSAAAMRLQIASDPAAKDPFDYWRDQVFYNFSAEKRVDPARRFAAKAQAVISQRGEFVDAMSADLAGQRSKTRISRDDQGSLSIGYMLDGWRDHATTEERYRAGPGDLYVYDAAQPSSLSLTSHRMVYVAISADEVERVCGSTRLPEATLRQHLLNAPLLPFLRMQMAMLVAPERADSPSVDGMLDSAIDLSLIMLGQALGHDPTESAPFRRALLRAATQTITENLDAPELDGALLARRLGCSRATLYRAFADVNLTVAGQIRTLRLIRARYLLEHAAPEQQTGDLAAQCGLDVVHFSRQFRQHFGIAPRELKGLRFGHSEPALGA